MKHIFKVGKMVLKTIRKQNINLGKQEILKNLKQVTRSLSSTPNNPFLRGQYFQLNVVIRISYKRERNFEQKNITIF